VGIRGGEEMSYTDKANSPKGHKLKVMIVLGGGGHTAQMIKLVELLGERYEYIYVVSYNDKLSISKIKREGRICYLSKPRIYGESWLITLLRSLASSIQAFFIVATTRPDTIISTGPGIAIPLIIAGKIFKSKIIFIEDWSRIRTASLSGRIAYFFADLFFIQWPELKRIYPKGIYAGRLA